MISAPLMRPSNDFSTVTWIMLTECDAVNLPFTNVAALVSSYSLTDATVVMPRMSLMANVVFGATLTIGVFGPRPRWRLRPAMVEPFEFDDAVVASATDW